MTEGSCHGNVTVATNKTQNLAQTEWFLWWRKKKACSKPPTYRERYELREDQANVCGCNSGSPLRDVVSFFFLKRELIRLLKSILPEPVHPNGKLSELICLTTCKKVRHTMCRWYRTAHIPCSRLLRHALYKRCLNSNP